MPRCKPEAASDKDSGMRHLVPNEKLRQLAGASRTNVATARLLERGLDAGESRVQARADALHDRDDRNRNAGGDETVLDGGRARLVLHKLHQILHVQLLRVHTWLSERGPGAVISQLNRNRGGPYSIPLALRLISMMKIEVLV